MAAMYDLRARSRESLRRGLLLSGAIHVALLFAFLHLPGSEEAILRLNSSPVDVFRQPAPRVIPLPPADSPTAPPAFDESGIVRPVPDWKLPRKFEFSGITGLEETGERRSDAGSSEPGEGTEAPPNPPPPDVVYPVGKAEVPPEPIVAPKPPYPGIAREIEITGRVVAHVLVRSDGTVGRVEIRSGSTILANSVRETLYRWQFRPGSIGGRPVSVWVEIPVVFTL